MKHKTIIFALLGVLIAVFIFVRYGLLLDSIALKPRFKRYIIHLKYKCDTYTNHRYEYEYKRNYRK